MAYAKKSVQEWGEFGEQVWDKVDAVRSAARDGGDVKGAVKDLVDTASDVPGDGRHAEQVGKAAAEFAADYAVRAVDEAGKDSGKDSAKNVSAVVDGQRLSAECADSAADCAGVGNAQSAQLLRSGRGPPSRHGDDYGRSSRHGGDDYGDDDDDDQPNGTDDYLNDRIAADQGAKDLAAAKKDADAGKMTAADYAAEEKAQSQRADKAAAARQQIDDDDAQLVDDVVDGHAELSSTQAEVGR